MREVGNLVRRVVRFSVILLASLGILATAGCPSNAPPANIKGSNDGGSDKSKPRGQRNVASIRGAGSKIEIKPKPPLPLPPAPAEPLHQPQVHLTAAHQQLCRVKVGDAMPAIRLPDLSGKQHKLSDLYGDKLTVVVFWNDRKLFAREQFSRLALDTDRFAQFGVRVVAINVGDPPELVNQLSAQNPGQYISLLDADQTAFDSVATAKLPRTFVLDAEGRVIWLDIEFSRATERELRNALYWHLLPAGERFLPADADMIPSGSLAPISGSLSG